MVEGKVGCHGCKTCVLVESWCDGKEMRGTESGMLTGCESRYVVGHHQCEVDVYG